MSCADGDWLRTRDSAVELRVRLVPRASRQGVRGLYGDRLKVSVNAAPVGGQANQALCRFIADEAGVAASQVRIVSGEKDRSKTLLVECTQPEEMFVRLRSKLTPPRSN